MTTCTLCDLPIPAEPVTTPETEGAFCCRGCLAVYRQFGADPPDGRAPDPAAVAGAAEGAAAGAADESGAAPPDAATAYFSVDGMHCTTCERFLEAVAADADGVFGADASYATEMLRVEYDGDEHDASGLADLLGGFGYRLAEPGDDGAGFRDAFAFDRYRAAAAVLVMMPVLSLYVLFVYPTYLGIYPRSFLYGSNVTTMVFGALAVWSTLAVAGLGYPFFRGAVVSLRVGQPNVDVLVSLAVLAAYGYSMVSLLVLGDRTVYFDVAVMVLVVVTVGDHVEKRVKRRALDGHADLADGQAPEARRLADDGSTETVAPDDCAPGDRLLVKPGERVPVDGTVVEGTAAVDESLVTGESVPRPTEPGDEVVGGSVVTDDALVVEVGEDASSTLDRIVERTWDAQSADAGVQRYVDRFAVLFVPFVVVLAAATAAGWAVAGRPPGEAILVGVAVLVISCPCSLGIATPLALAAGSRAASEAGALVRNAELLERGPDSEVVVLDKTGTLTTGSMHVAGVDADDPEAVLARAAAVERRASHPVADAVRDAGPDDLPDVSGFEGGPRGVAGTVEGTRVAVGHPSSFAGPEWTVPTAVERAADDAYAAGEVPVLVGWDGRARGVVRVRDEPRDGWRAVLSDLDADGRRVVVLTGDDERRTRTFADHPAVDEVLAGVRPAAKERIVRRLRREGTVTMVGDGTNDAAALAAADLGVALARGTDVAMDAADAVVTTNDLRAVPGLFEVAAATRARVRQNLGWAVAYNAVAIPVAVAGLVNPLVAAALMAASSLVVVTNSRRSLA